MNDRNPFSEDGKLSSKQVPTQRQQPSPRQQRTSAARMPKAQALALLRKMKRGIVIASFLSFGTFSALAMGHTVSTTAQQTTTATTTTATVTPTATKKTTAATPTATATKKTVTPTATAQQGGGYGFGSSTSTSQPVSGTRTS
jgi:hypothetical protein